VPGLAAGTYSLRVRDHGNAAVVGVSNSFTITAPSIGINALPASTLLNAALAVSGTVSPGSAAVRVGMSSSATTPPATWQNATVSNGAWSVSVIPTATGTVYIWAQQTSATSVQAISGAVSVSAASLSISTATTGTAGTALTVSGTVYPASDAVNVQLATQNTTAPTSGWVAATNSAGSISASLTPPAAGTYYAWGQDPATGVNAVSGAITVSAAPTISLGFNNPGGSYPHGTGTIGLNGAVTPAQAASVQVALSTSNTVAPTTGWQAASVIYNNTLWAIFYTTPATAGNYYVWVETTAGVAQAVSSFTVSVT
jgi:hypothetical protein